MQNAEAVRTQPKKGKDAYLASVSKNLLLTQQLIPFSVNRKVSEEVKTSTESDPLPSDAIVGKLLLDTGAIGASVVSTEFYNKLCAADCDTVVRDVDSDLLTATHIETLTNKEITFNIYAKSEANSIVSIPITAIVAPIYVDLIIDKEAIKSDSLLRWFPSHFAKGALLEELKAFLKPKRKRGRSNSPTRTKKRGQQVSPVISLNQLYVSAPVWSSAWIEERQADSRAARQNFFAHIREFESKHTLAHELIHDEGTGPSFLAHLLAEKPEGEYAEARYKSYISQYSSNMSRKPAYDREGNLTGIPDNKLEAIPAEMLNEDHSDNDYTQVHIEGPKLLQNKLRALVAEFKTIFKSSVQGEPAKLIPFKLEVDKTDWEQPKNKLQCRRVDKEKEVELNKFIELLIRNKVIEPCNASYYSHAFLVPKPNGKWRLVLDFKNLNGATTNYYKWPIPDIKEMLNRVGDSRPQFFAVFDLTSGYYQAPIEEGARDYTAFMTRSGIYRWLRLPMGLTGAGSYFQHSLTTQVLQEVMHRGVELYLDDCMVHAQTEEEFLSRLRTVFRRFRDSGITLNPMKCSLGLPEVEYVGQTINANGLHFTRDKLDSVLNFPRPKNKRQIKSFIGLANYFRDHIKNHSNRVEPLQKLVDGYEKRQARHVVVWSQEAIAAFEDIRKAIDECPMLWFLDDFSPIYLQTDASDYGIGAYLYQVISQADGTTVEHPVGFISKSIASAHTSWDTPMKEGFAIFYALHKWEYLLRDREFTVRTDHQNLTRLRNERSTNKMVKRWFMAFQEYDIKEYQFVRGVDNMVPDEFSRLCKEEPDDHPATLLFHLTGESTIPEEEWDKINSVHNFYNGHGGVQRTLALLDEKDQSWVGRTKHVRRFISLCPCCQKMDQVKRVVHSYPFTTSTYGLWHTVSIDYLESMKPDNDGNNMIIVIVDNFSRYTDLYPCNSTKAEGAADAVLQFVGRFPTPLQFTTDSGSNFKSQLFKELGKRLGADHVLTKAYSKEQNAIVERQNKEVRRHLRNIIFDRRVAAKWSKYLPIIQRIINSSVNKSTGLSPAQIVFPNGMQMDQSLLTASGEMFYSDYIRDMQTAQNQIIAICEQHLRAKDAKHIAEYSEVRTIYENGSYVLAEHRHNSLRRGPKSKLLPFLRGPLLVISHREDGMYVLQDLITQVYVDYHVSRLREFNYNDKTKQPLAVAVTDTLDEFVAEKCLKMKGNVRGSRMDLKFKIRWAGYSPADDTWEPWSYCRDSAAVRNFCASHGDARVRRLVPKDYVADAAPREAEDISESEMSEDETE